MKVVRRLSHVGLGVVCAVVLTACGSGQSGSAAVTSSGASASATASASPSPAASATSQVPRPTPSSTAPSTLKIGQTYTDDVVSTTVQKVAINKKTDSDPYSGILVKTCVVGLGGYDYISFSWQSWTLTDADSGRYPDNGTVYGYTPTPVYPNGESDGTFKVGDCAKGWIFFDVPEGTKVTQVRYQAEDMEAPAVWTL
ncbi:MAG: hypothetical protein ACRCYU_16050 [Nocardioides sp.]